MKTWKIWIPYHAALVVKINAETAEDAENMAMKITPKLCIHCSKAGIQILDSDDARNVETEESDSGNKN